VPAAETLSPQRRLAAFRISSGGWEARMVNVVRHVCA
jgi:hypothetical protein